MQVNYLLGYGGNGLGWFLSVPFLLGITTDKTQGKSEDFFLSDFLKNDIHNRNIFINIYMYNIFKYRY